jgi:mannose-1-phosphate guanylyltransferase
MGMNEDSRFYACIMAGGSGERFWPMSRARSPKQLTKLFGDSTLIEDTVKRLEGVVPRANIFVLTNEVQLAATRAALPMLPPEQIVAEPAKRDTAPAAALATALVHVRNPNARLALLPSDALIHDHALFREQLRDALEYAATHERFLTFGIKPWFAATGFGYLELTENETKWNASRVRAVRRFVEKPTEAVAQTYLASGRHLWNAGIFIWSPRAFVTEAATHAPELARFVESFPAQGQAEFIRDKFPALPKISVDFAIMEKARAVETVEARFDWDDVGSWTALPKHLPADTAGNTIRGKVAVVASNNNIAVSNGRTIALCGVKDLVVVETADAILVCHRDAVQDVKKICGHLPPELL